MKNEEGIALYCPTQVLYGDGHTAVAVLLDNSGLIFARMQEQGVPGTQADMVNAINDGSAVLIQFVDKAAVGRVIGLLTEVMENMQ